MSLQHRFDPANRVIWPRVFGALAPVDLFDYQRAVRSRAPMASWSEILDLRGATEMFEPTPDHLRLLAVAAVAIDPPLCDARLAIVADSDETRRFAHQYLMYRGMQPQSTREARVFGTFEEACTFLGIPVLDWEVCESFA